MWDLKNLNMVLVMRFVLPCMLLLWIGGCTRYPHPKPPIGVPQTNACHGQDILGLARQDVDRIARYWESGECLGVLQNTFGDAIPAVRKILDTGKHIPGIRWHLSFCNHGSQCQPGECKPTDLVCMQKSAREIQRLHDWYAPRGIGCYISPRLEYTERNRDRVNSWFKAVKAVAPRCTLVASPTTGSYVPPGVLVEHHGNNPSQAHIVSNDGANYFDSDSVNYNKKGTVMNLKWTPRNNLRLTSEKGAAPPPLKRSIKNRLEMRDLQQMQVMKHVLPPMPVPSFCGSFRRLGRNEIWKNHSEDYGPNNDSRGNKPLLISAKKGSRWDVFNAKGEKVACIKYYGPFGALHRMYMGSCSGDHAMNLYKKAGHWVFIKDGSTCIGVPSVRRWGSFR